MTDIWIFFKLHYTDTRYIDLIKNNSFHVSFFLGIFLLFIFFFQKEKTRARWITSNRLDHWILLNIMQDYSFSHIWLCVSVSSNFYLLKWALDFKIRALTKLPNYNKPHNLNRWCLTTERKELNCLKVWWLPTKMSPSQNFHRYY